MEIVPTTAPNKARLQKTETMERDFSLAQRLESSQSKSIDMEAFPTVLDRIMQIIEDITITQINLTDLWSIRV